jgi:hypothetical protein
MRYQTTRSQTSARRLAVTLFCLPYLASTALGAVFPGPASVSGVEGSPFNGTVATFTTNDSSPSIGNYSSTVDWGDGTLTAGSIVAMPGGFAVTGVHTYAEEGAYLMSISISDFGDASQANTPNAAYVRDAPLAAHGIYFGSQAGVLFSGTVAGFSDYNPYALVSDFTATIDWGDGTISSGTITAAVSGGYHVAGSHAYSVSGLKTVIVTINDAGGSSATAISYTGDRIFANGFDP